MGSRGYSASPRGTLVKEVSDFSVQSPNDSAQSGRAHRTGILRYLEALTFEFSVDGKSVACVLVYAEPDPDRPGAYRPVAARDTGFEGIACVDDTARAALLALGVYEQNQSRRALDLARRWLSFVEYMQYPDGSFANFIRDASGTRNATGPTSRKGGYWWSVRALWALARAYRVTGDERYLEHYLACLLEPTADGKLNAVLALGELELYKRVPSAALQQTIRDRCRFIAGLGGDHYFRDQPDTDTVQLWGYHQLHAVAEAARVFGDRVLWDACLPTVENLVAPDVRARFWYSFPDRDKRGVCAYTVTPIAQGLAASYRVGGREEHRRLAVQALDWYYGRNDAHTAMYDPTTGMCRDGIDGDVPSENFGAESSIEAGLADLERQAMGLTG